ncbi:glycosyl hydrolases family 15-domain-containing protein [Radiomyces spectabilis]|uniref:glycosyl hydrolases family 15-domain-containing protein n=1 Tax=Radiomyces spectabilis TaxID=64574 RepID=UPI00221F7C9E|nr:glycosyl hydrolases family 15-domain-containing protein [Radiomyces spectabilis]KAI8372813.1 glycosyl hydrolases family 15-domain-containing protein [Radiomyces spectabilis]
MTYLPRKQVLERLDYYYKAIYSTILAKQNAATGLIPASVAVTSHGNYTDAWVRDNVYSIYAVYGLALAYRRIDDTSGRTFELEHSVIKNMRGLLFAMMRQSQKVEAFKYTQALEHSLHAKYDTNTGETVVGDFEWGHLQLDATALFMLALADMTTSGFTIVYSQDEVDFVQNLVFYIERAYRTPDYGIWERGNKINHGQPELNSSSIGMVVAALKAINGINLFGARGGTSSVIRVLPDELTRNATTLHSFLPRESNSKEIDGSILSVIGFPAFAVDDPELMMRSKSEAIKKLEGRYGWKRFLRDGHQTVLEDTSRLHYNANELKVFEDIESEWPLFFTYMLLEGLFTDDRIQVENYRQKLQPLLIYGNSGTSLDSSAMQTHGQEIVSSPVDMCSPSPTGFPLLAELYYVPEHAVEAEKANPHSQQRCPNDNVPLVWANSLYTLGNLMYENLLSPSEMDPLGRRYMTAKRETIVQIALIAEDAELQSILSSMYGLETQTADQIVSTITILPPNALADIYAGLGLNTKMGMSGRPKRPIGVLGTSRLYRIQGQIYAFTPHFMDNNEFYLNADPDYLVSAFESELSFTSQNWFYAGRPTMTVILTRSLLGGLQTSSGAPMDPSRKNLLNFFLSLRNGLCSGIRVRLSRLAETMNTSNIESLDFLLDKPEINWDLIRRNASRRGSFRKLAYSESATQASTPGAKTPGAKTPRRRSMHLQTKSISLPSSAQQDDTYFHALADALSKLKSNVEPEFRLKDHKDSSPTNKHEKQSRSPNGAAAVDEDETETESPMEMLSLTLGDSSQFDQAVESLAASVNLYDQIDLLQYMLSCKPKNSYIERLDATLQELLEEVYLKSMKLQYWFIARQAAGLLQKMVPSLTICITDLVIRQKQVSIGSGPHEYLISAPVTPDTLNRMIVEHCHDAVREGPLVQEVLIYLGSFIRTSPQMLDGILRLRTHYIIIALREEIRRMNHCNEEEAIDHLMQLSPYELKLLLATILSGPHLTTTNIVVRDKPGGYVMLAQLPEQTSIVSPLEIGHHEYPNSPSITQLKDDTHLVVRVQSAGYCAGNFAKLEINGSAMDATSRGIHVWTMTLRDKVVIERASFDTHISEEESADFVRFLNWIPARTVVVIAAKDEFTEHLTTEAVEALEALGSRKIRQVRYRDSYVFVGERGCPEEVWEAHHGSMDGPTEIFEKRIQLNPQTVPSANNDILASCFPNSNGRWLHRRKNDGALNRVPSGFFPQTWNILNRSQGLCIHQHILPRDPIVLEKTPEEFNFALAVEGFLGFCKDPAERQIAVEILTVISRLQEHQPRMMINDIIDLPLIMESAARRFCKKWAEINKATLAEKPMFKHGFDYDKHRETVLELFFDLPQEGPDSTFEYLSETIVEILKL